MNRFDHEDEANEGKRRRANPEDEAQRKQQKCDIHKQKQQACKPVSYYTHTDQELPANQQQAAPSTEVRTQELSTRSARDTLRDRRVRVIKV